MKLMAPIPELTLTRRTLLKAMTMLSVAPGALTGCSAPVEPLRFGVTPWIGSEPFYLARDTNLLPETTELLHFANQSEKNTAIMSGDLDMITATLDEVLQLRALGIPLTVVTVLSVSSGADMLIARRDEMGNSLMKPGARVGYEPNSIGVLMLLMILDKLGLQKQQLTLVPLAVGEQQKQAWFKGEIDAAITYEPFASEMIRMGCEVYITSRDLPRYIYDVVAVRTPLISKMSVQIQQLIESYEHGLKHFVVYQDDSMYRMAARQNMTIEEAQTSLQGVIIPGKPLNEKWLSPQSEFIEAAQSVNRLLFKEGIIPSLDAFENFFDDRFL